MKGPLFEVHSRFYSVAFVVEKEGKCEESSYYKKE